MRTIAVITGTRSEYGYLKPLMEAIAHDKDLALQPLVTGMHLFSDFGCTSTAVLNDFPDATIVPMDLPGDKLSDMAEYLASGIKNFSCQFQLHRPDIVVVLGDRSESLAAALAALYHNIPIAHINGGDVSGTTIDESIRHAITKLAHLHFVHSKENATRVERMGEDPHHIYITGSLALDTILHANLPSKQEIFAKYGLDSSKPLFLVVHHPVTTLPDKGLSQLKALFNALDALKEQTVVIYPNCDAGGQEFIAYLHSIEQQSFIHAFQSLPHVDYLALLKNTDVMLGNSSSGILEAPSFRIPVINIGSRQQGRARLENILDVDPDTKQILHAIHTAMNDKHFRKTLHKVSNPLGNGTAAQSIIKILKDVPLTPSLIQKQITY